MERFASSLSITLDSVLADGPDISTGDFGSGVVMIPAASSITVLNFYAATDKGGTYYPLYSSSNVIVSRTVAAERAYALPDECFGVRWLKILANADGAVTLTFKS
jgi:hypothetical protein